ncbi:MAG: ribonuclease Z [Balneolaceae bacterium]|nr:ribonuclease Z [Balneolaceae bacterium]MBO6546506.1 ribonuclease Z [Balneolaceae bacterium]MBO6648865.1 ribonuclease Z [Balneolaceae bacterium]
MIVVPLGIASATPTAVRHLPAVALWREGSVFLFDCGENAQMSMLQAGLKRSKIDAIFISHFDVDHYSGLMGLLSTLQLQRRDKELTIAGPKGIKEFVEWNLNFSGVQLGFDINYSEVDEKEEVTRVVDADDYYVEARPLKHRRFCLGFRFQEKDKPGKVDAEKAEKLGITDDQQFKDLKAGNNIKLDDGTEIEAYEIVGHARPGDSFAYVSDTEYCPNAVKLAMNTNILYHEATFGNQLADKAKETGHSTAGDAARVATEAQTKLLVIGHFSARYTNLHVLLKEARDGFYPTWLANELRPIFTDPTHERGIIKPKVEIKDLTKNSSSGGYSSHSSGRRDNRGQSRGGKNFRSRRGSGGGNYNRDNRGGGNYNRDNRGGGGYRSNNRYNSGSGDRNRDDRYNRGSGERRSYGSSSYNRDRGRSEDNDSQPKKTITPRTSYDDFDRF